MIDEPGFFDARPGRLLKPSRWSTGSALLAAAFGRGLQEGALQQIASDPTHTVACQGVDEMHVGDRRTVEHGREPTPTYRSGPTRSPRGIPSPRPRSEERPRPPESESALGRPDPREEAGPPHRPPGPRATGLCDASPDPRASVQLAMGRTIGGNDPPGKSGEALVAGTLPGGTGHLWCPGSGRTPGCQGNCWGEPDSVRPRGVAAPAALDSSHHRRHAWRHAVSTAR